MYVNYKVLFLCKFLEIVNTTFEGMRKEEKVL